MDVGVPHSGLMFAARITLAHFSVSSAISLPKSAGEPGSITGLPAGFIAPCLPMTAPRWEVQKVGDFRAILAVPLIREGVPIGVLGLTRSEPRPFSEKQIDLLTTFADQAVTAQHE
jgi:hypothetical protein